jgi:predicted Zn-dependent peptidase
LESNMAKMNRLVTAELNTGEYLGLSAAVERYNSVTAHDVRVLAARLAESPKSVVAVGEPLLSDLLS